MDLSATDVATAAGTAKTVFDSLRTMLGVFKDVKDLLPEDRKQAAESAIEASARQIAIAEAEIALSLGYQLCRCEFPPTIMLAVGLSNARGAPQGPVYECPKCHSNTAHPHLFYRTKELG